MLIDRNRSFLLLVDVQDRLLPAMAEPEILLRNAAILLKAAARLGVPVLASEQYPRGLGHTVPELTSFVQFPTAATTRPPRSRNRQFPSF